VARLILLALLAACSAAPPPPAGPRVASLAPAITETLGALGRLDVVVARSAWCTVPAEAAAIPAAGSALTPDLERLAALRPSVVLVDGSVGTATGDLERLAPVERLPWLTVEEVVASTRRLGALVDARAPADALADRLEATLDAAPPAEGPVALVVIGQGRLTDGEVWYVRDDSLHGAAIRAAGLRNAIPAPPASAPSIGLEALIRLDPPNVVVLVDGEAAGTEAAVRADWGRLTALRAVREGRLRVVQAPRLLATGPSILDAVATIRTATADLARPSGPPP
jgi:ABC-type Fe3+-hydroxamate transport system substrate-binding protein